MIKTEDLLKKTPEELLSEGLRPATLTEGSELFLHGFDEEDFSDSLACPYCGKTLTGGFDEKGAFRKGCDCESYIKETSIRKRWAKAVARLSKELDELNEAAKKSALSLVKGNTLMFIDARKIRIREELDSLECFKPDGTN